jgi:hypothetical protein
MSSAYQRPDPSAASATDAETRPERPSDRAALPGDSDEASAAIPNPATATSVSGSSQMKSR